MNGEIPSGLPVETPFIPVQTPEHPVAMPSVNEKMEAPKKTLEENIAEVKATAIAKEKFSADWSEAHKENKKIDRQKEKEEAREKRRLEREAAKEAREKMVLELKEKVAKTKEDLRNKWLEAKGTLKAGPEINALRRKDNAERFKQWTEDTADRIEGNLNRAKRSVENFGKKQVEKVKVKFNDIKTDILERREIANAKIEDRETSRAANKQAEAAKRKFDMYQEQLMKAEELAKVFKPANDVAEQGHHLMNEAAWHLADLQAKRVARLQEKKGQ